MGNIQGSTSVPSAYTVVPNKTKADIANAPIKTNDNVVTNDAGKINQEDLRGAYVNALKTNQSIYIQTETGSNQFICVNLKSPEGKAQIEKMINDLKTGTSVDLNGTSFKIQKGKVEYQSVLNYETNGKVLDEKLAANDHYSTLKANGGALYGTERKEASISDFQGFRMYLDSSKQNTPEGIQALFAQKFGVKLSDEDAKAFHGYVNNGVASSSDVTKMQTILTKLDPAFKDALAENGSVDGAYGFATTKAVNMLSYAFNPKALDQRFASSQTTKNLMDNYDIRAVGVDISGSMESDILGVSEHEKALNKNQTQLYSFNNYAKAPTSHGIVGDGNDMYTTLKNAPHQGIDYESSLSAGISIVQNLPVGTDGKVASTNGKPPAVVLYTDEADYSPEKFNTLVDEANKKGVKVIIVAIDNKSASSAVIDITNPKYADALKADTSKTKYYSSETIYKKDEKTQQMVATNEKQKELDWWALAKVK